MARCVKCGADFGWVPTPAGGRPPKYCPPHRKARGIALSPAAVNARRRAAKAASDAAADDPRIAAMLAAAEELAPELLTNSVSASARALEIGIGIFTLRLLRSHAAVSPRDLALVVRNLIGARAELLGDEAAKQPYTHLEVVFSTDAVPVGGTPCAVEP